MSYVAGCESPSLSPSDLVGLDLEKALCLIRDSGGRLNKYYYRSSGEARFTVLDVRVRKDREGMDEYTLFLAGKNPVDYLPAIYQENPFLEEFLWIFQHMQYEQIRTLDSLHSFFIPEEAPAPFLNWMASWFGMDAEKCGFDEKTIRALLQKGLSLFQWRGTAKGLAVYLEITTGMKPQILENTFPQSDFVLLGEKKVNEIIRNHMDRRVPFFTVHFPVDIDSFNQAEKSRIATIVEQEKPAHSMYYISFDRPEIKRQKGILISDEQILF